MSTSQNATMDSASRRQDSFDPEAEKTCEELLNLALRTDPGNTEALQSLASVRLSQRRPEEAQQCLEQAWVLWKDLDQGVLKHSLLLVNDDNSTYASVQMTRAYHRYPPEYHSSKCSSRHRSTNPPLPCLRAS